MHVATNQYPWLTFCKREGRDFSADLSAGLADVAAAGLDGYEPLIESPAQLDELHPLLAKHGLEMRSFYVNSTLHEPDEAERSIERICLLAGKARAMGVQIVVTNPNPISWSAPGDKDDAQLAAQADALNRLGARLGGLGLTLAYHNHDAELRQAAREFHHMMVATDPACVSLCLDAHWIFRGSGNSALAVGDVVSLYGPRVRELHVRQSVGGAWCEVFDEGDIDYAALALALADANVHPLVVLEQAVEQASPSTLRAVEAHRRSDANARRILAALSD